ncbi:MAG: hypothetical protein Q8S13_02275, partial [Dehalococcoidia bacterium]|nr:hypothetical protein [Dehalococcoidia bacterium]
MAESQHTPRPGFLDRLIALKDAIGKVQPNADYRGNFAALHAVCVLDETIAAVLVDIAPFVGINAAAHALALEMTLIVRRVVDAFEHGEDSPDFIEDIAQ